MGCEGRLEEKARRACEIRPSGRARSAGTSLSQRLWVDAFVQRLRELGSSEGRTITIDYRWAEGLPERFSEPTTRPPAAEGSLREDAGL
jgi:hypothetical protein